ncbi:MAG: helix-hairpin-helix domain-containing protein [Planctomycetota bacterium]|nr:helix-hairpin-helix domain-containing protein [Planctomycetota bacterium]
MMPNPVMQLETPLSIATKKNGIVYSVMVQACLCFTLIILFLFTCSRHFYSSSFSASNPKSEKLDSLKLDLNQSDYGELAQIPGIGKSIALEIVNYRKAFGGFNSLDEIEKIKGVGKKTAEKIRRHLVVAGATPITEFSAPRIWIPPNSVAGKSIPIGKINLVSEKIDPNLATFEELKKLPGIGDTLAKRIVDKRQDMLFYDENDLQKVSGIGKKTASKIAPFLKFPLISQ